MHYWHFPINGYELGPVYTICIFQHIYKDCHVGRLIFPFDIGPNTTENSGGARVAADHHGKARSGPHSPTPMRTVYTTNQKSDESPTKEKQREAGGAVRQKSDKAVIDTKKELAKVAGVTIQTTQNAETMAVT